MRVSIRILWGLMCMIAVLSACTVRPIKETPPDFKPFFDEYGVDGCFLLYDTKKDIYQVYNSVRCEQGFLPASTFEIMASLIALETGVISDEDMIIPWDGVTRTVEEWNRDHSLSSALKYSVTPFFQEVARKIGAERMKEFVDDSDYAKMDISVDNIDRFWIWENSRITSWDQMDFILHFYTNKLPFSQANIDLVKKLIVLKSTDSWVFSGKTGMTVQDGAQVGWMIGYLETKDNVWLYVCNVGSGIDNPRFKESRRGITEKVFNSLGLMEE